MRKKKKRIGITLRVENIKLRGEKLDVLSQDWIKFLQKLDVIPILIPNNLENVQDFLNEIKIDGVILSGGDNIGEYPERDNTEIELINYAKNYCLPLLGVCRGMQVLNHHFGGRLELSTKSEHVGKSHAIEFTNSKLKKIFNTNSIIVNSFHNNLIQKDKLAKGLKIFALAKSDQTVEGFFHQELPFIGVMWHPERNEDIENESKLMNIFWKRLLWDN